MRNLRRAGRGGCDNQVWEGGRSPEGEREQVSAMPDCSRRHALHGRGIPGKIVNYFLSGK